MQRVLIFDSETEAISPIKAAAPPAFVAAGWSWDGEEPITISEDAVSVRSMVLAALNDGTLIVGHNLAFDFAVLGLKPGRSAQVWDTMVADLLIRLAETDCWSDQPGPPRVRSLEDVLGRPLSGKGTVQLSFRRGLPLTETQRAYLRQDIAATWMVYDRQRRKGVPGGVPELTRQVRARMALDQLERTGLPIDWGVCDELRLRYQQVRNDAAVCLREFGFHHPTGKGPRGGVKKERLDTKAFREYVLSLSEERGVEPEATPKGSLVIDSQYLGQLCDDPIIAAWRAYKDAEKLISTYLRAWDEGRQERVHCRYTLMARTGRTTSWGPNLQQIPSRGWRAELKRAFCAPPGHVLFELDYHQLELCTLAQLTKGRLAEVINSGQDCHRWLAGWFFHKPQDDVTKAERQLMKAANFGLPGGMGVAKFRQHIRSYGLPDPGEDTARALVRTWHEAYPEMADWLADDVEIHSDIRAVWAGREPRDEFLTIAEEVTEEALIERAEETGVLAPPKTKIVYRHFRTADRAWEEADRLRRSLPKAMQKRLAKREGSPGLEMWLVGRSVSVPSGRTRYPVTYTEQRNTRFQGLAADVCKDALAALVLDCAGLCTVHAFVHDSVLISLPVGAEKRVADVAGIMLTAAKWWLPDVRVGVEAVGPGQNWFETKKGGVKNYEL